MNRSRSGWLIASATIVLALCLGACSEDNTGPGGTGTVRLMLVDAPAPIEGIEALTLLLSDVRIHQSESAEGDEDGGWIDLMPDTLAPADRSFELLELVNGVEAVLGESELATGTYTQIRLVVEEASITINGSTHPLDIPSGMQSGLKLIAPFSIVADEITVLTLDFDAARSVIESPPGSENFKLKPTIRVVASDISGSISGVVLPPDIGAQVLAVAVATGDTATMTFPEPVTGAYTLPALLPGDYDVTAVAAGYADSTVAGVSVASQNETSGVDFTLESTD